ncbi:hypothetical protein LTR85_008964 [Meristemomyces frigidus]|nr:hypothetical protein LTR85_008964 [Meristemomyces frigidus]
MPAKPGELMAASRALELKLNVAIGNSQRGVRALDLLDLPPEIRNCIYEYAVVMPEGEAIEIRTQYYAPHHGQGQQPVITRVCRQLRRETLPMYYSMNRLTTSVGYIEDVQTQKIAVNAWLAAVGETNAGHIRRLVVGYDGDDQHGKVEAIRWSKGFRAVRKVAELREWTADEQQVRDEEA